MAFVYIDYDDCRAVGNKVLEMSKKCEILSKAVFGTSGGNDAALQISQLAESLRLLGADIKEVSDELGSVDDQVLKELGEGI